MATLPITCKPNKGWISISPGAENSIKSSVLALDELGLLQRLQHPGRHFDRFLRGKERPSQNIRWCTKQVRTGPRADGCHQLVDVGGDATLLMHKGKDLDSDATCA